MKDIVSPMPIKYLYREKLEWVELMRFSLPLYCGTFEDSWRRDFQRLQHQNFVACSCQLLREGKFSYRDSAGTVVTEPGDLYIALPGNHVEMSNVEGFGSRRWIVVVYGPLLDTVMRQLKFHKSKPIRLAEPQKIIDLMQQIRALLRKKMPGTEAEAGKLAFLLLLEAARQNHAFHQEIPDKLSYALRYMEHHLAESFGLPELAEYLDVPIIRIYRDFKKYRGVPPMTCLRQLRLERARQLLETTTLSGKEIGVRVGIPDRKYFSALFKREFGRSVSRYRREHAAADESH